MTKQWHCKIFDQEMGPLSREELKQLVETGTLGRDDSVRQENSTIWVPARLVRDLFDPPATEITSDLSDTHDPSSSIQSPIKKNRKSQNRSEDWSDRLHKPIVKWAWGGGILFIVGTVLASWYSANRVGFPEPRFRDTSLSPLRKVKIERAPIPRQPTFSGLPKGTPVLVPGLEDLQAPFSPSMTTDLKTIVFADLGNPGTAYDLYLSERDRINSPFGKPQLIKECVSPMTDAYPTISEDGLEIIFIRGDLNCEIWHSRRESLNADFAPPVQWEPSEVEIRGDSRLATPQFLDNYHLRFNLYSTTTEDQRIFLSKRPTRSSPFGPPEIMPFVNHSAPYFISENGRRAYYGTSDGLYISIRPPSKPVFRQPELLIDSSISGPIDGPVFVVPKEDVVVYCSSGGGENPPTTRLLWMLRY